MASIGKILVGTSAIEQEHLAPPSYHRRDPPGACAAHHHLLRKAPRPIATVKELIGPSHLPGSLLYLPALNRQ